MESEMRGSEGPGGTRSSQGKIWAPPCLMAALILILSSTPGAYYPERPDYINNIAHFMEFGILAFLLARALHKGLLLTGRGLFLWTMTICVSFGLLDEAHQFLVPERIFDLVDVFFDSMGALAGFGIYILYRVMRSGSLMTGAAKNPEVDD